ncbi:hypothetical protein BH11BAC1_BH11BAC1_04290 [soil metagenome]
MKKNLFILIIVISSINCFAQLPSWLSTNGLVAWYPFAGNANDNSGNGNNGTVFGATLTMDRFGNLNNAYHFDSTYILGSCTNFPTADRTISIWYKGDNIGMGTPSSKAVFGYGGLICGQSWLEVLDSILFQVAMHCNGNRTSYLNGSQINNTWHHWLITAGDIVNTRFYIDGQFVLDTNTHYVTNTIGKNFTIGGIPDITGIGYYTDGNVASYKGDIDDVAIYDHVLSLCEINQLYFSSKLAAGIQDSNQVLINGNTAFVIVSSSDSCLTFQWQQDCGTGFSNLSNAGIYSGVNNDTLIINPVSLSQNNCHYRCIVNSCLFCVDTTNYATLNVITGINEYKTNEGIAIYPNPSQGNFEINFDNSPESKTHSIIIRNVLLQTILETKTNQQKLEINLNEVANKGVYFLEFKNEKQEIVGLRKIIIE